MTVDLLVNIDVDDLDRAVAFYTTALPLRVGRRFGGGGVELLGGSSPIYLLVKAAGSKGAPGAARSYGRHWTPVHLDIVVPDVDAAVASAVAAGATVESPTTKHSWGTIAMLADPFGHGFCLIQFSERGYDAIVSAATE
jgi:predicted enzyme related to lactoylglutathione lyase